MKRLAFGLVLIVFTGCRVLFGDPVSTCCSFNTADLKIQLSCSNQKINHCQIIIRADQPNTSGESFFDQKYSTPVNEITIPTPNDSIKKNRTLIINLWTSDYTINDYSIDVKPSDWSGNKIVYGSYSYR